MSDNSKKPEPYGIRPSSICEAPSHQMRRVERVHLIHNMLKTLHTCPGQNQSLHVEC